MAAWPWSTSCAATARKRQWPSARICTRSSLSPPTVRPPVRPQTDRGPTDSTAHTRRADVTRERMWSEAQQCAWPQPRHGRCVVQPGAAAQGIGIASAIACDGPISFSSAAFSTARSSTLHAYASIQPKCARRSGGNSTSAVHRANQCDPSECSHCTAGRTNPLVASSSSALRSSSSFVLLACAPELIEPQVAICSRGVLLLTRLRAALLGFLSVSASLSETTAIDDVSCGLQRFHQPFYQGC